MKKLILLLTLSFVLFFSCKRADINVIDIEDDDSPIIARYGDYVITQKQLETLVYANKDLQLKIYSNTEYMDNFLSDYLKDIALYDQIKKNIENDKELQKRMISVDLFNELANKKFVINYFVATLNLGDPTDEELRDYYDQNRHIIEKVEMQVIKLFYKDEKEREIKVGLAQNIVDNLKKGDRFVNLFMKYNEDKNLIAAGKLDGTPGQYTFLQNVEIKKNDIFIAEYSNIIYVVWIIDYKGYDENYQIVYDRYQLSITENKLEFIRDNFLSDHKFESNSGILFRGRKQVYPDRPWEKLSP